MLLQAEAPERGVELPETALCGGVRPCGVPETRFSGRDVGCDELTTGEQTVIVMTMLVEFVEGSLTASLASST